MRIFINGREVEYALGDERTLGEALDSLSKWAGERGEVILGVRADGAEVAPGDEAARARSLGDVARLDIEASSVKVLVVETLGEVREYANRARNLLPAVADEVEAGSASERLDQFVEALPWLERVFLRLEEILGDEIGRVAAEGRTLRVLLEDLRDLGPSLRAAAPAERAAILRGRAADVLGGLAAAIPVILGRLEAATGPTSDAAREIAEEIGATIGDVRRLPARLEEIAVQIQVGDESAAMSRFAAEIGLLERAFRLVERGRAALALSPAEWTIGGEAWEARSEKVSSLLEEMLGAFERGDRVLISDLLEYELSPASEGLAAALEEILHRLESKPI